MSPSFLNFSIENYRAFAREQKIELRPLTLFFGWNSGGKSALVRFLPLLVESIKANGPPIWLAGDVGRDATWPELVCKATKRSNLKFGLSGLSDGGTFSIKWDINGDLAGKWQEIKSISFKKELGKVFSNENLGHEITYIGPSNEFSDEWKGYPTSLLRENFEGQDVIGQLNLDVKSILKPLVSKVQWISGVRIRPQRLVTYGGGNSPTLKPDGSNAANHLIEAQLRSINDPVLRETGAFFSSLGEDLVLDNPMDGAWRVMLRPSGSPEVKVNLCDTGEGYAQVLPVLVALARAKFGGPNLLCLEQPELHLHTRAQAELAKVLVSTVKSESEPTILMETHSEVLLTSIQLAIANRDISEEMVRVYWVESRADGTSDVIPVDFDSNGQPKDTTLVDAFGEAVALGRQLMVKQLESHQL
ncbi:ATP-binding protein [Undibacterium seohonense]|uniref:ATP-binding protein n=1 Tax=Undibacterium seohonense TaxID=1344950 RepID=A0ABR6X1H1_9BURK|nr:AAA family ATPase [Undibacterium seohonense]MBC3806752.1 ATP-binding protein [Undibacterium seohonense]